MSDTFQSLATRLKPPLGIILGSPREAAEVAALLPNERVVCYQMDLYQADRLRMGLAERDSKAEVLVSADLWDLPAEFKTIVYPVPADGERELKLDMLEQAYHILASQGTLHVVSPFERDQLFPKAMKKIF